MAELLIPVVAAEIKTLAIAAFVLSLDFNRAYVWRMHPYQRKRKYAGAN
jgi:hypothetical protein